MAMAARQAAVTRISMATALAVSDRLEPCHSIFMLPGDARSLRAEGEAEALLWAGILVCGLGGAGRCQSVLAPLPAGRTWGPCHGGF